MKYPKWLHVSDIVRYIRHKLNLTQADFAGLLGVSRLTVTRWENGVRRPTISTLNKMAGISSELTSDVFEWIYTHLKESNALPPFDHNVPDQCPFAVNERPSSCSECPNSGGCPFFTYEEEEDD